MSKDGELIRLVDDDATEWYVAGHVAYYAAIQEVRAYLQGEVDDEERPGVPTLGRVRHAWARWVPAEDDIGDKVMVFTLTKQGKGTFKVTVVCDLDDRLRGAAQDVEDARATDALVARVLAWLPSAQIQWANHDGVGFRLSGLAHPVYFESDGSISVAQVDKDAWERLYAAAIKQEVQDE
jgi:hypothetical protein